MSLWDSLFSKQATPEQSGSLWDSLFSSPKVDAKKQTRTADLANMIQGNADNKPNFAQKLWGAAGSMISPFAPLMKEASRPGQAVMGGIMGLRESKDKPIEQKGMSDILGPITRAKRAWTGEQPVSLSEMTGEEPGKITPRKIAVALTTDPLNYIGGGAAKTGMSLGAKLGIKAEGEIPLIEKLAAKLTPEVKTSEKVIPEIAKKSQWERRGAVSTIKQNPLTSQELSLGVGEFTKKQTRNTANLLSKAKNLAETDINTARNILDNPHLYPNVNEDVRTAIGMEVIKKLDSNPKTRDMAIQYADALTKSALDKGRATQLWSYYSRLTPAGQLKFAENTLKRASQELGQELKLTPKDKTAIWNDAQKLKDAMDGSREQQVLLASIAKRVYDKIPSSMADKLSTAQTIGQLLNFKTAGRNILGNAMFSAFENLSQAVVGTPVDMAVTGIRRIFDKSVKRTTGLPSLKTQISGMAKGAKEGFQDAMMGINTSAIQGNKYDLATKTTFNGPILGTLEKMLNIALRVPDRAMFMSAFDDSIRMQKKLAGLSADAKPTQEMIDNANALGMYRTFNDDSAIAQIMSTIKDAMNKVGIGGKNGRRFGIGDIALKYAKTPGNIATRAIEYSPAGYARSLYEIGKPLFTKEFNQKAFVDSFARATTGTAAGFGIGYMLANLGIITEKPSQDRDVRGLQKTIGQGGYQINVSGLKRFIVSLGNPKVAQLKDGDTLVSYDWALPVSSTVSLGAKLALTKDYKDIKGMSKTFVGPVSEASQLITEQPMLSGVQRLVSGYGTPVENLMSTASDVPASFVPTALSQIAQKKENTARELYDPNILSSTVKKVQAKIPGLREKLPEKVNVLGEKQEQFQNKGNTWFNVFLNPSFVSKYKPTPEASKVLGLMQETGLATHLPQVAPTKLDVGGVKIELSPEERIQMQKNLGGNYKDIVSKMTQNKAFNSMTPDDQVKEINSVLGDLNKFARAYYFRNIPEAKRTDILLQAMKAQKTPQQIGAMFDRLIDNGIANEQDIMKAIEIYNNPTPKKISTNPGMIDNIVNALTLTQPAEAGDVKRGIVDPTQEKRYLKGSAAYGKKIGVKPDDLYKAYVEFQLAETNKKLQPNPLQIKGIEKEIFSGKWRTKVKALGLTPNNIRSAEKAPEAAMLSLFINNYYENRRRKREGKAPIKIDLSTREKRAETWKRIYNTKADKNGSVEYYLDRTKNVGWL